MRRNSAMLLIAFLTLPLGCAESEEQGSASSARNRYNEATQALAEADWEAAEEGLLEARDEAGTDGELRFFAAYNLGLAYALHAESLVEEDVEQAIGLLRQSAAWFRDAIRMRSEDDARQNLEIALRRIQVLADQLNRGQNSLEARLDRLIEDQRSLRDDIRQLMEQVDDPDQQRHVLAFEDDFDALAVGQRTLSAEAGVVSDLAGDELGFIEQTPEEERNDQQRMRAAQLQALDMFVQIGRTAMSDARGQLRRFDGDRAHRSIDAALEALKRAREQLADPIRVLRAIAEDQTMLWMQTRALDQLSAGAIRLEADAAIEAPVWLTNDFLAQEQREIEPRTDQVLQLFVAGTQAAVDEAAQRIESVAPESPEALQQQRIIEAAGEAVPFVEVALANMGAAAAAIEEGELAASLESQQQAIESLFEAIERFSDIRSLIELLYADQMQVIALLTPPDQMEASEPENEQLSTEERSRLIEESLGRNRRRLDRLFVMISDELQLLEMQSEAAAQTGQEPAPEAEQLAAERQRYELAETLRQQASERLAELVERLAEPTTQLEPEPMALPVDPADSPLPTVLPARQIDPLEAAESTLESIEELRRLFFSIIEHLQDLLAQQSETHDQTASSRDVDEMAMGAHLGPIAERQRRHAALGEPLAAAIEQQADEAAAAQDEAAQQVATRLAEAAPEVRAAAEAMNDATELLDESVEHADVESIDLEPTLDVQIAAMDHLANAIRILQPPQPQQQEGEQQQGEEQQQGGRAEEQERFSQRQAEQRLQAVREREAQRRRERREREMTPPEPVERNW